MDAPVVAERERGGIERGPSALERVLAGPDGASRMGKVPYEMEVFARKGASQKRGSQSKPRGGH